MTVKVFKSIDAIKKYNPYHDALGRFTSATGVGVNSGSYSIPRNERNLKNVNIPEGIKVFSGGVYCFD